MSLLTTFNRLATARKFALVSIVTWFVLVLNLCMAAPWHYHRTANYFETAPTAPIFSPPAPTQGNKQEPELDYGRFFMQMLALTLFAPVVAIVILLAYCGVRNAARSLAPAETPADESKAPPSAAKKEPIFAVYRHREGDDEGNGKRSTDAVQHMMSQAFRSHGARGHRFLVIGDSLDPCREIRRRLVDHFGPETVVNTAGDGEALNRQLESIDAIVLDCPAPGVKGLGLLMAIKEKCARPVIAITNDDTLGRAALKVGAYDYFLLTNHHSDSVAPFPMVVAKALDWSRRHQFQQEMKFDHRGQKKYDRHGYRQPLSLQEEIKALTVNLAFKLREGFQIIARLGDGLIKWFK